MIFFLFQLSFIYYTESCYSNFNIYEIDYDKLSSLHAIKFKLNNSKLFPSYYGGVSVIKGGNVYHPWSPNIKYKLIDKKVLNSATVQLEWIMYLENEFYYHYGVTCSDTNNYIKVSFNDLGKISNNSYNDEYAEVFAVYLDRCENAVKPFIIGVPYLTTFNILLANDHFISMYFDWNKSNASQILPYNKIYSESSVYYSQYALYNPLTNGKRNTLNETIILKYSYDLDSVLPDIENPISKYRNESLNRIVYDDWAGFDTGEERLAKLINSDIKNIWHILHNWQHHGYDVKLPDVLPANPRFGGNFHLNKISELNSKNNNLFSLHENYIDIFSESSVFRTENLSLNSNGYFILNWINPFTSDSSYLIKPSKILNHLIPISSKIKSTFNTNSSYHDVSASYDPSKFVDYDSKTENAGKLIEPFNKFKALADTLRNIHKGPVSSEGLSHYLYAGYYDDICAQIHTAKSLPGQYYGPTEKLGGYYKPILVNFDLLKLQNKAIVHGVGYYSRFFYNYLNPWGYTGLSKDSALIYSATELAYGHGAFFSSDSYNYIEQALLEYNYVYPVQLLYGNAKVIKILYNDDGELISASNYIRKYPNSFDEFGSDNFMSQVYIEYDNNLKIFVNRHTKKDWLINYNNVNGYYCYHALIDNVDTLFSGNNVGKVFILPKENGWLCFFKK